MKFLCNKTSKKASGSILEAPGLDFGAPKLDFNDFLDIWGRFLPSKSSKTCLLKSTMPKMQKRLKSLKSPTFFKVHRKEHDHKGLFYHRGRGKKGWAAVVPPWGFQLNPPHPARDGKAYEIVPYSSCTRSILASLRALRIPLGYLKCPHVICPGTF